MESRFNVFSVIILILTFVVPVLVLPMFLHNPFNTPKTTLALTGAALMVFLYACRVLGGREILVSAASTAKVLLLLFILNVFSFFYTGNPYYTTHAVIMNLTALALFYFTSLYVTTRGAFLILLAVAASGVLVSMETYLQFLGIFVIFKWAHPGSVVMGTIGNSNYLGAYLIFPLMALAGLVFLVKGKVRLVPLILFVFVFGAFLFTRARAAWFGFFISIFIFLAMMKKVYGFRLSGYLKSHLRQVGTWVIVSLSILVFLWSIAPQRFHAMMEFRNVTDPLSLRLRIQKYGKASWWLFTQNPLFGTGLWSYRNQVFEAQAGINQAEHGFFKDFPEPKPESVHNEYLEVLNDGGLVAASVLLLFLILLFSHAWRIIDDDRLDRKVRVMAVSTTSATTAILLAAFFFFAFRINSTLFMTGLVMGLTEGFYLRSKGLISPRSFQKLTARVVLIPVVFLLLAGVVWFKGIRLFKAEMEYFRHREALARGNGVDAEKYLLKAIEWDPHNTIYAFDASQIYMNLLKDHGKASDFIDRAIHDYNGDITRWSLYYFKGLLRYQTGSLFEAQAAFEKALYYNPEFTRARQKLEEVNKVIRENDRILIRFR
jgi:O-antigen ligase